MLSIFINREPTHFPLGVGIQPAVKQYGSGDSRRATRFIVSSKSAGFIVVGNYDEILDLCSDIAQSVMSWPITNNRPDWFTDSESEIIGKVATDDGPDGSRSAGGADGGSGLTREWIGRWLRS